MNAKITRNTVWRSIHGVKTKIKDMDDAYLANLSDFLKKRCGRHKTRRVIQLLKVIEKLRKERGLSKAFMDRAQIPYKNPKKKWEIWDFEENRPKVLQEKP